MSEMVDKALRAWLVKSHDYVGTVGLFEELRPDELAEGRDCMRAALAALREPTEAMVEAGNDYDCSPLAADVWRTMLDEALK